MGRRILAISGVELFGNLPTEQSEGFREMIISEQYFSPSLYDTDYFGATILSFGTHFTYSHLLLSKPQKV